MKILLITGMSGSGKSTIAKKLCENNRYNLICSYTDRPKRDKYDTDHIFVDSNYMDLLLERSDIVAQSTIEGYRYCTIRSQFLDNNIINIYIVDVNGMNDIFDSFPYADIMSILIRRNDIDVDCIRQGRDVIVPLRDDVDFLINNDTKIESAVGTINALVGFDFFNKPSHKIKGIEEKIDYIDNQYRYLSEIKTSLYEQIWYQYRGLYLKMCQYVHDKINNDFDFEINIIPDYEPQIFDGELEFNIIGEYKKDIEWADINRMIERMSFYARTFCKENNCNNIIYHLFIAENYVGDEYE